jgi:hypothetical protein
MKRTEKRRKQAGLEQAESARSTLTEQEICQRIAEKAYGLYEKRGRVHGADVEDWLEAERLVLGELQDQNVHGTEKWHKQTDQVRVRSSSVP